VASTWVGIEVSPLACRIVEIERDPRWGPRPPDTRVRSFAEMPLASPDMTRALGALAGRRAAVVVWDVLCDHRVITVADRRYQTMRAEAISQFAESMPDAYIDGRRLLADIAPAGPRVEGAGRRSVMLAVADRAAVGAVLRPIAAAGVRIQSVVTPALALLSLARMRRAMATPDAIDAYVALEETASCAVLVHNGVLIAAHDLAWGFEDETRRLRPRQDVAARLGDELTALFACADGPVRRVCICGGLSDLRSTAMPLIERLDVEVETLDSLFAIDAAALPEPADAFREQASGLRLAWAVAADWPAPLNLRRDAHRRSTNGALARAAVAAGVAVGLGGAWSMERAPVDAPPVRLARSMSRPLPPQRRPAPARRPDTPMRPPAVPLAPSEMAQPMAAAEQHAAFVHTRRAVRAASGPKRVPGETAGPFDAALGTILFAPNRQLAIIDGRIVQAGDAVKGARIVGITPTRVMLRDGAGRARELTLSAAVAK
jgi:hypothetical protein